MEISILDLKENGVVIVTDYIPENELITLKCEFDKFCNDKVSRYNKHLEYSKGTGRKLITSEMPDKLLTKQFFKSKNFEDIARLYLEEPFELNKEVFVVEDVPASEHAAQQLHYDIARTLKFFLYLEDTTAENGAFYCVPGSHKWTVRRREEYSDQIIPGNRSFTRQLTKEYGGAKPVEGKAGTLIIFDTDVFHQAGKVRTGRRRVMRGHTRTIREMEEQKIRYENAKQKSFVQRMLDKFR